MLSLEFGNLVRGNHGHVSRHQFKSEDEEMERELDKIERRFKVYSRELEKEKPVEAETGDVAGSLKTSTSVGSDTNTNNKERFATVALKFVSG